MLTTATVVALTMLSGNAFAQVFSADVRAEVVVEPPVVVFEVAPPLVVISPGVMVVQDYDVEVFYVSGWYWTMRGGVWFRTRNYHGGWRRAPGRYVPGRLVRMKPGRYRHFHGRGHRVVRRGGGGGGHHAGRSHGGRSHDGRSHGGRATRVRDHRGGGHHGGRRGR